LPTGESVLPCQGGEPSVAMGRVAAGDGGRGVRLVRGHRVGASWGAAKGTVTIAVRVNLQYTWLNFFLNKVIYLHYF